MANKEERMVTLTIDGVQVSVPPGTMIVEAAAKAGIKIPTLCNNKRLVPYGACRICTVEISQNNRTRLVASCVYPVEEGLIVKTDTPQVSKTRKLLIELMLASSPTAKKIQELASKYGVKSPRFTAEKTNCILCGQTTCKDHLDERGLACNRCAPGARKKRVSTGPGDIGGVS